MRFVQPAALIAMGLSILTSCASDDPVQSSRSDAASQMSAQGSGDENDPRWHAQALEIAQHYHFWGRLDDVARFAPFLCREPWPPAAQYSQAKARTPHARKLYSLYAKDAAGYGAPPTVYLGGDEKPKILTLFEDLEQAIVKEAWIPESLGTDDEDPRIADGESWGRSRLRPVKKDGHWWGADEPAGLFLMFKPQETDLPTDAGWVYATVSADLKMVSGAGRMDSCMRCHEKLEGRLFGLPDGPPADDR